MIQEIICVVLMCIGTFFMVVAGVGIVRMPDLFMRLSASTKASTLGVLFIFTATTIYFHEFGATSRILATVVFVLLTAPVAAHKIGRAAYLENVPLWKGTRHDELRGKYRPDTLPSPASPTGSFSE